jgi:hypothetical protein
MGIGAGLQAFGQAFTPQSIAGFQQIARQAEEAPLRREILEGQAASVRRSNSEQQKKLDVAAESLRLRQEAVQKDPVIMKYAETKGLNPNDPIDMTLLSTRLVSKQSAARAMATIESQGSITGKPGSEDLLLSADAAFKAGKYEVANNILNKMLTDGIEASSLDLENKRNAAIVRDMQAKGLQRDERLAAVNESLTPAVNEVSQVLRSALNSGDLEGYTAVYDGLSPEMTSRLPANLESQFDTVRARSLSSDKTVQQKIYKHETAKRLFAIKDKAQVAESIKDTDGLKDALEDHQKLVETRKGVMSPEEIKEATVYNAYLRDTRQKLLIEKKDETATAHKYQAIYEHIDPESDLAQLISSGSSDQTTLWSALISQGPEMNTILSKTLGVKGKDDFLKFTADKGASFYPQLQAAKLMEAKQSLAQNNLPSEIKSRTKKNFAPSAVEGYWGTKAENKVVDPLKSIIPGLGLSAPGVYLNPTTGEASSAFLGGTRSNPTLTTIDIDDTDGTVVRREFPVDPLTREVMGDGKLISRKTLMSRVEEHFETTPEANSNPRGYLLDMWDRVDSSIRASVLDVVEHKKVSSRGELIGTEDRYVKKVDISDDEAEDLLRDMRVMQRMIDNVPGQGGLWPFNLLSPDVAVDMGQIKSLYKRALDISTKATRLGLIDTVNDTLTNK